MAEQFCFEGQWYGLEEYQRRMVLAGKATPEQYGLSPRAFEEKIEPVLPVTPTPQAPTFVPMANEVSESVPVEELTEKEEKKRLRELLKEKGITVVGNPSIENMKAKLNS